MFRLRTFSLNVMLEFPTVTFYLTSRLGEHYYSLLTPFPELLSSHSQGKLHPFRVCGVFPLDVWMILQLLQTFRLSHAALWSFGGFKIQTCLGLQGLCADLWPGLCFLNLCVAVSCSCLSIHLKSRSCTEADIFCTPLFLRKCVFVKGILLCDIGDLHSRKPPQLSWTGVQIMFVERNSQETE